MAKEEDTPPADSSLGGKGEIGVGKWSQGATLRDPGPDFEGWPFGPHELTYLSPEYIGEDSSSVNSDALGSSDDLIHPYKMRQYEKFMTFLPGGKNGEMTTVLRVYWGEIHYTVVGIKPEGFEYPASSAEYRYSITEQDAIPGIRQTIAKEFTIAEQGGQGGGAVYNRFVEFIEDPDGRFKVEKGKDPEPSTAFGNVYVSWELNESNKSIKNARIQILKDGEPAPEDGKIGKLREVGAQLIREDPKTGLYHRKIGVSVDTSLDENEEQRPIEQHQYDHIYYATTIVAEAAASGSPSITYTVPDSYSYDNHVIGPNPVEPIKINGKIDIHNAKGGGERADKNEDDLGDNADEPEGKHVDNQNIGEHEGIDKQGGAGG